MSYLMESKTKNTAQPQFERLEYPQQFLLISAHFVLHLTFSLPTIFLILLTR